MDCVRCGNPTPETAAFCPACGARVPGGPPPAPALARAASVPSREDATMLSGAQVTAEPAALATVLGAAADANATLLSSVPLEPSAETEAAGAEAASGPDVTMIGRPLAARAAEGDATILSIGADPDATLIGRPPVGRAGDANATMLGAPRDSDATMLGGPPIGVASPGDVTVIGSPPRRRTGTMVRTPRTPMRMSAARAARTMGGQEIQPGEGDGPLAIGEQFGRYTIIRLLGIGGMGAVYQAWDEELEVVVALKVIQTDGSVDAATVAEIERRFKRELLLARRVTHRNVVRIFDLGEIDGIKYITMSYVNGVDLTHLLEAEGKLPAPKALQIIRGVVDGLVAAHDADVVHRDLKPANIMLAAGSDDPLIMDFGIARTTSAPQEKSKGLTDGSFTASSALTQATMAGAVVGTLGYMAPEQAKGQEVDQRADVYALGLIFYDLLLGMQRQQQTPKPFEELMLRMKGSPPSPRSVDAEIPEDIDRIIMRCIDPDPTARYQTSKALKDELDGLDAEGKPLPRFRRLTPRMVAAVSVVGLGLISLLGWSGWTVYQERQAAAERNREPVSVVIADFENRTNDTTFDRTLEPMVKLALEGAGFISAYDRAGIRRTLGVRPPEQFDEPAAREVALKQGLGVVLSGSVARDGDRFEVSVKATQAVTGNVITTATNRTSNKSEVLGLATSAAASVRRALGDRTSDADQRFAMETLSATSLEVVREYASAMQALADSKFEDARNSFAAAAKLNPDFGLAYAGMAIASSNLDKRQEAEQHVKEAIRHLDGMTERERYRTRGMYYYLTGDYQACAKEYGDLIARYAADAAARNNLALCMTKLRDMPGAVEQMQNVVKIVPNRPLYRENLATYASYSSDFELGEKLSRALQEPTMFGWLALAFAQIGREQVPAAAETYRTLGRIDELGASYMASGLADIALYEGRFSDAARILTTAAATDVGAEDLDRAAAKYAALAYARLLQGQPAQAIAAAEQALTHSSAVTIRFLAARTFVEAGQTARAKALAAELGLEFQAEPRAYAKIIEGLMALANKQPREAVKVLMEATTLLDTWIGRYDLGRAYFEAGAFTQADSEFDRCLKRRGEALSLFVDEEPTYAYFPPVYYYQGRVREQLGTSAYADAYRAYLKVRGTSSEDGLVADVRTRIGR